MPRVRGDVDCVAYDDRLDVHLSRRHCVACRAAYSICTQARARRQTLPFKQCAAHLYDVRSNDIDSRGEQDAATEASYGRRRNDLCFYGWHLGYDVSRTMCARSNLGFLQAHFVLYDCAARHRGRHSNLCLSSRTCAVAALHSTDLYAEEARQHQGTRLAAPNREANEAAVRGWRCDPRRGHPSTRLS